MTAITSGIRPNILLIMADQLAPQFLPCYGHRVVQAPSIASLAENGVVFDAAYTNSPLCAPSRFVMMSGRLPSRIAAWDNAVEFSSEIPTFAHYLHDAGYHTCLSGKMHFVGPDQLHGFSERLTTDVYLSDFHWHPRWDLPGERLDWYHNMEVVTRAGVCARSMYLDYDDEVIFKAKRFLFDKVRSNDVRPFLLTVSMIQPHDPYLCRQEHWQRYREEDIDLPQVPLGSVDMHAHDARLRHSYGADEVDLDDNTIARARRAYYGSISDIDDKVADLLQALTEAGYSENTIVVVTADHGDMLGERGLWFKMSYHEHSARVPLIVHAPKIFRSRRIDQAVSLVDLLPTLVEISRDGRDGDYATAIEGRSLVTHLSGGDGHDDVIGEYFAEGVNGPMFMLRREGLKFIAVSGEPSRLYDLKADPLECVNLADDPAWAQQVAGFVRELEDAYDVQALSARVQESQQRRRFLARVMRDQNLSWDFVPVEDAAHSYIRSSVPIYALEKRARFPSL
ncbi:MAG: choline-sulfatase [Gammaproteobacteria bacterium]|nr:choline-sulfatase [Gammaproteobacteria bacterium]